MPGRRTDHEHHATLEGPANTNWRLRHQKDRRRTLRSAATQLFRGFALSWPRFLLSLIVLFAAINFGFGLLLYRLRFGSLARPTGVAGARDAERVLRIRTARYSAYIDTSSPATLFARFEARPVSEPPLLSDVDHALHVPPSGGTNVAPISVSRGRLVGDCRGAWPPISIF
jgi:hypothetical protein